MISDFCWLAHCMANRMPALELFEKSVGARILYMAKGLKNILFWFLNREKTP
jgi:hypothetical protein